MARATAGISLKALDHTLAIDLLVSTLTLLIHWSTFSGVMAATVAGLLTSLAHSGAKRLFGHMQGNCCFPGVFHVRVE